MTKLALAADLGGTNIRMAVVDDRGEVIGDDVKLPVPAAVEPPELVVQIGEMAEKCHAKLRSRSIDWKPEVVAFTAPAPVAKDFDGVLTKLPNLPTLVGMDLKGEIEKLFGLPVFIENDATAAAIGENWIGAGRGVRNMICATLGTGIGGGIMVNGEPIRGKDGIGGEIGHICVEPNGHPCGCGSRGCVEQYASGTAIVRLASERGMNVETAKDVYQACQAGDPGAREVFLEMGRYLGMMLAGLINTLNPEMLVICGGVTEGWDAFADAIANEIRFRAYAVGAERARLVKGELGDRAGMIGAARSAFLRLN